MGLAGSGWNMLHSGGSCQVAVTCKVGITITNHPFGNGSYQHIPTMYGDLGDGVLLLYQIADHCGILGIPGVSLNLLK